MYITRPACRLSDLQDWVRRHKPPVCMFMPDRLPDVNVSKVNEGKFRSLSRLMIENQVVSPLRMLDICSRSHMPFVPTPDRYNPVERARTTSGRGHHRIPEPLVNRAAYWCRVHQRPVPGLHCPRQLAIELRLFQVYLAVIKSSNEP